MRLGARGLASLVLGSLLALAGCGGGGGGGGDSTPPPAPPPSANTPVIGTQPQAASAVAGTLPTFTVAATANGSLSYQWRFNGVAIDGATAATLTFASGVTATNAGS